MRGVYVASYRIAAHTAAKTLMYLTAPAAAIVEILSARVSNESNETNEQIAACLQRITTLGTPTATTVTAAKTEAGSAAAASTVKANVTASEPTYGAIAQGADILDVFGLAGQPSLGGWEYVPLPEERLYIAPSGSVGIRLLAAVTAFDLDVVLTFREIG